MTVVGSAVCDRFLHLAGPPTAVMLLHRPAATILCPASPHFPEPKWTPAIARLEDPSPPPTVPQAEDPAAVPPQVSSSFAA